MAPGPDRDDVVAQCRLGQSLMMSAASAGLSLSIGGLETYNALGTKCDACWKKSDPAGVRLDVCSGCKSASYCDVTCQRKNYSTHRQYCRDQRRIAEVFDDFCDAIEPDLVDIMDTIALEPGRVVILHFSGAKLSGQAGIKHALRACCSSTTEILSHDHELRGVTSVLLNQAEHVAALKAARDRPCVIVQAGNMELSHFARVFSFEPPAVVEPRGPTAGWGWHLRGRGYSAGSPMVSRWAEAPGGPSAPSAVGSGPSWTSPSWTTSAS